MFELEARALVGDLGAQVALELLPRCFLVLPRLRSIRIVCEPARLRFDDRAPARQVDVGWACVRRVAHFVLDIEAPEQLSNPLADEVFRFAPRIP